MKRITAFHKRWSDLITYVPLVLAMILLQTGCSQTQEATEEVGETAEEAADVVPGVGETEFNVPLTGAAEVPGPGDTDGSGTSDVTFDLEDGEVCYEIAVQNVEPITAAHIHRGSADTSGPPVVDLAVATNGLEGCVTAQDRNLLQEILDNPAGFYVNVHNEEYPAGALRGQLGS